MFSGIVDSIGKIIYKEKTESGARFCVLVSTATYLNNLPIGSSISINGACMTIEKKANKRFYFSAVNESLKKTNLSELNKNDFINLEKPLRINSFIHGHIVTGHIDITGKITKIQQIGSSWEVYIKFDKSNRKYVIAKGSIAINGISLTIAEILKPIRNEQIIKIAIIPHTLKNTIFKFNKVGDKVNIEFDITGKYILNKN